MQLKLNRDAERPLHRQIEAHIRALIESGDLAVGVLLPATRVLAQSLGVNRATVTTAYESLAASGFVEACVGRGTQVVRRSLPAPTGNRPAPSSIDWSSLLSEVVERQPPPLEPAGREEDSRSERIDLSALLPDEKLFPVQRLRRCLDDSLRENASRLLQYGPPAGLREFREVLAQRMRLSGMQVDADDILVVNGAQQGLDLFCKALVDPGDAVAIESPTYGNLLPVLRVHRAEAVPIPMTPEGLDLDRLEAALQARRIKFLYTMPHFQNPTGITSSLLHRRRLIEIAARHGLTILEDGYEADLRWDGGEVLPLRALDASGRVCYVGTFSKGLCPGFRIGWLVAPREFLAHLAQLKRATDYHTSLVLQAALTEFCRRGEYDVHLRRLRRVYRRRMAAAARALETHLPEGVRWRVPEGGYALWVELPPGISGDEVYGRLSRDGVQVTPGRHFFTEEPGYGCFRLSISRVDVPQIEKGIATLGRHLQELARQAPREDARIAVPYI